MAYRKKTARGRRNSGYSARGGVQRKRKSYRAGSKRGNTRSSRGQTVKLVIEHVGAGQSLQNFAEAAGVMQKPSAPSRKAAF